MSLSYLTFKYYKLPIIQTGEKKTYPRNQALIEK
jgi:hypothetical protein